MQELSFDKQQIPLWSGGTGAVKVSVDVADPAAPLAPGPNPIANASFNVDGNQDIALGNVGSVAIGVKAGMSFTLAPLWQNQIQAAPDVVSKYSLTGSLTADNMLLALQLGANADLSAAGSFRYSVLTAGATLGAGVDGSFTQVRAYARTKGFASMLADFFEHLKLPGGVTTPPEAGEVIALEYGGYLKFGLNASAGYEIKGSKSWELGQLKLSEAYDLSVIGKLGITSNLAGRFSIEVRAGAEPGWAAVTVRRSRTKDFGLTADLNVAAEIDTQGLPTSGKDFLGAVLGVRAKNWLNLIDSSIDEAGQLASMDAIKAKLDGLANDFLSKYIGKAVDQLLPDEATAALKRLQSVVDSYQQLDQSAIALFDRFFDPVLGTVTALETRLTDLAKMVSWDSLKGDIDPTLWNIVSQLTDGDPLSWMLDGASLTKLIERVNGALALIQSDAHAEIRKIITLAKTEFGLDRFFGELAKVDTPDKLKTALTTEAQHFVDRLLNQELDKLDGPALKKAFGIVQKVVQAKDAFWDKFSAALQEAARQQFSLGIQAAYSTSSEQDALLDFDLRLVDQAGAPVPLGQKLMGLAGRGDFQEVLAQYQPDVVRLRKGSLSHNTVTSTGVKINIAGWHLNYQYQEMYQVIVNADQQIVPTGAGGLNVFTTVALTNDKDVKRNGADLHTKFLLTFLGESHNGSFDAASKSYLIDVITGQSASYDVSFTDSKTTPAELGKALLFANTLGLHVLDVTPVLQVVNGNYGAVTVQYAVRFLPVGLERLFAQKRPTLAQDIRGILRRIVVANYAGQGSISDVGWLYASDDVQKLYQDNGPNFVNADSVLGGATVRLSSPIPGISPPNHFSNTQAIRILTATIFDIEQHLINAFTGLQDVLTTAGPIQFDDLRESVTEFGNALKAFDQGTIGDNTTFAVFDGLIQLATPASEARASSMGLTAQQHQITVTSNTAALAAAG